MTSSQMQSLWLASAIACVGGTACFAGGGYWVVGNRATNTCDIVTSNPVIDGSIGPIFFGSGPYKSLDDAKLARSTIGVCPEKDPTA